MNTNEKVLIRNLANWTLTFTRINFPGDVVIPPKGKMFLQADEVLAQVYNNNRLFVGNDGKGSHARIFIEDDKVRQEAGFEANDSKQQNILTNDKLKLLYEIKTLADFKKKIQSMVITQAEKEMLADYAKKNKINDHDKINYVEKHTGFKVV